MTLNVYLDSLDEIDSKIVQMLSEDGRIRDTEIAKKVGLSKTSVRLRKLKLIKNKKIKIIGVPVLRNLNLVDANILIKFEINTPRSQIEAFVKKLLKEEYIYEVNRVLSEYDLIIAVYHSNFALLKAYIQDLFENFKSIEDYYVIPVLQTDKAFGVPL
ncbi:MAG: helix-turn-helix protein [Thermoplasmatales archaeon I-plasma]|jgi:DNA-binding Lrp family transcriptional regulator|nr:MAG: helix-turn-helix protein [Thermoplasmatales archaeon I-plasma]